MGRYNSRLPERARNPCTIFKPHSTPSLVRLTEPNRSVGISECTLRPIQFSACRQIDFTCYGTSMVRSTLQLSRHRIRCAHSLSLRELSVHIEVSKWSMAVEIGCALHTLLMQLRYMECGQNITRPQLRYMALEDTTSASHWSPSTELRPHLELPTASIVSTHLSDCLRCGDMHISESRRLFDQAMAGCYRSSNRSSDRAALACLLLLNLHTMPNHNYL